MRGKNKPDALEQLPTPIQQVAALMLKIKSNPSNTELTELRDLLANDDVVRALPGVSTMVLHALIGKFTKDTVNRETYIAKANLMHRNLGYKDSTGIERHLIERIVICWLHLQFVELQSAATTEGTYSMKEAEFQDRMVMRAHARYMRAIESLERVRAMVKANKVLDAQVREAEARADIWQARKPKTLKLVGSNAG